MKFEAFGFGKKEVGLAAAAALAACSPEANKDPIEAQASSVMQEDGNGNVEIMLPQETVSEGIELSPQYTPEQVEEILSGTTKESDDMSTEEIEKLDDPQ